MVHRSAPGGRPVAMLTALPPRPRQFGRLADLAVPENFHDPLPGLESSAQEGNSPTKLRFFPTIPTPQFRHCDVTFAQGAAVGAGGSIQSRVACPALSAVTERPDQRYQACGVLSMGG